MRSVLDPGGRGSGAEVESIHCTFSSSVKPDSILMIAIRSLCRVRGGKKADNTRNATDWPVVRHLRRKSDRCQGRELVIRRAGGTFVERAGDKVGSSGEVKLLKGKDVVGDPWGSVCDALKTESRVDQNR